MKKTIVSLLLIVLCTGIFVGCGNTSTSSSTAGKKQEAFSGTIQEVLDSIVAKAIELDTDKEYGIKSIECTPTLIDADSCTDILGLTTEDFNKKVKSSIESKPDGSWYTHSIVVLLVKDGVDVASLAESIVKNTKPNRFGCLKPKSIVGGYTGNYIFFTASDSSSCEAVFGAVKALSKADTVRIDRANDWNDGGLMG